MAARTSAIDWSEHPLGWPENWPRSLQGAMHLMLASHHPMCVFWGRDLFFFYNDAYRLTLGSERHPASLGQRAIDVWGEVWELVAPQLDQVMTGHGATWHEAQPIAMTRNGRRDISYWTYGYTPVWEPTAANEIGGVLVTCQDVTAAYGAHARQIQALTALEAIIEHARDLIVTLDASHLLLQASRRAVEVIGLPAEALLGRRLTELVHEEDRHDVERELSAIVRGENLAGFESRLLRADGTWLPMLWSAAWVASEQRVYLVGRDLTERLDIERRLRSAQRMEAIGRLTGRIAHDFNNILAIILGNAELLVEHLAEDPSARPQAELVASAAERGAQLVSRLLAYAQRQHLDSQRLEPSRFLPRLLRSLERQVAPGIGLDLHVAEGTWPVSVDSAQLESSIEDLVQNAADAMPAGGRIRIHCDNFEVEREQTLRASLGLVGGRHEITPGDYVRIVVEDEGSGMTPDVQASAFEPFFTTKELGRGTGLGLSMVLGFIRQSQGHVGVVSSPGHGTRVTLLLPRLVEVGGAAVLAVTPERVSEPVGRAAAVLVVDDESAMRRHVVSQLQKAGYEVLDAEDAASALTHLESDRHIDLLFTDIIMPGGMNGRQLADHAQRMRPGLRVLYTSGYTAEALEGAESQGERHAVLAKPYRRGDLLAAVAQALGQGAGG